MRLIDADAVMDYYCSECDDEIMKSCRADPCCSVMEIITEAKTVEAVPVRHGYWNHIPDHDADWGLMEYFMCSECEFVEFGKTDYCPHCGAKMDGETNGID